MAAQPITAVFFCTPEPGHFQALRPLIGRLARQGMSVHVFTHVSFQRQVEAAGATFCDLFGAYSLDEADDESKPIPCRYVSFAAAYAVQVIEDVRALAPAIVLYETFSVIAPVVARALDVPYVNVCVHHNPNPERTLLALEYDPRIAISARCQWAVERLREEFGVGDASPFLYATALSPHLNIYSEPPEFLDEQDRTAFEPLAFFGCLPDSPRSSEARGTGHSFADASPGDLKIYASFGTIIWRYYTREALAALQALAQANDETGNVRTIISLGGADLPTDSIASLSRRNVQVLPYADQTRILEEADLFLTHHGINSTHEAILQGVPMVSYPFLADQPALAAKCQELGLAIPLATAVRGPVTPGDFQAAFSRFLATKAELHANLEIARRWELATIDKRQEVVDRIMGLAQSRAMYPELPRRW